MSLKLAKILADNPKVKTREELLALIPARVYDDGRTKLCHQDECDINKIMARFEKTQTISHLSKYEGVYADFSDFDFHEQTRKLTRGREIFDDLSAELRQEFGQNPARFFAYVNDPANAGELRTKLQGLAMPGRQLPSADEEAAQAAASEPASENQPAPDKVPAAGAPAAENAD